MAQGGLYAIYYPNPKAVELQGRVEWSCQSHHTRRKHRDSTVNALSQRCERALEVM
jgi:hypothetical protein